MRVLTIGHSYVVALNQAVPAAVAQDPDVELTLAAPTFHYGDLRRIHLERKDHPDYAIVPLRARLTRWNHVFWYDPAALKRLVTNASFDLVHMWEEPYTLAGFQIARITRSARVPLLFRTAQSLIKRYPWPFSAFERATLRATAGWVAGGQSVYDAMVAKGFPRDRGRVITLGVDMDHFLPPTSGEQTSTRQALGIEGPVVGYLGRLVSAKGLSILMEALDRVRIPWTLLAVGSGPCEQDIRRWAAQRGYSDRVRIVLAAHDEVPRYLGAMDILVAPSQTTRSWREQFGRMIIEAFSCRVPVIGSDSGEIPNVIGDAGIVVAESDVGAWATAIEQLLSDASRRSELAERGYRRCEARYANSRIAERYIGVNEGGTAGGPG